MPGRRPSSSARGDTTRRAPRYFASTSPDKSRTCARNLITAAEQLRSVRRGRERERLTGQRRDFLKASGALRQGNEMCFWSSFCTRFFLARKYSRHEFRCIFVLTSVKNVSNVISTISH